MFNKFTQKLTASVVAISLFLTLIIIPTAFSSAEESEADVEQTFAATLGAEVGETYIDADYSADGATVDGWDNGYIGTGESVTVTGLKLRNINGSQEAYYEVANTDFVAKLTVYHTKSSKCGLRFGTYDNTTSTLAYVWHGNGSQWWHASNYFRGFGAAANTSFTLGDTYATEDQTKPITIYIFSYDGTVYYVGDDGVEYLSYEAIANKVYLNANYCELILTDFSVKELTAFTGSVITYNANGGAFSDGTAESTITETIGEKFTVEMPTRENHRFLGWSTTENGEILTDTTATAALNGATLYAVWQVAHPEDENYTTGSVIDVDFSNWALSKNNNSYSGKDADGNTVYYFSDHQTENGDGEGDQYIRMDTTSVTSTVPGMGYYPNFALTMTDGGATDDTLILPNDTTFKLTLRVRINELNGVAAELRVFYGYTKSCNSGNGRFNSSETLVSGIGETNGEWVDIVTYFTTPKQYTDNDKTSGNICDKVYIALGPSSSALVQYDITNVKVEYSSKVNLYYELDGETELYSTVYGTPGTALDLPEYIDDEFYSDENETGGIKAYHFDKWYFGADSTEEAVAKFGDVDTNLYCKDILVALSSTENQDGYCGFDLYEEQLVGYSIDPSAAAVTDTDFCTGSKSMLVSKDTAFELRNDGSIAINKGKTYKVSFYYRSAAPLKVGIGTGLASNVPVTASAVSEISLDSAESWTKATLAVNLPYGTAENRALALIADINEVAYFDNITVSSAVSFAASEKQDEAFRVIFSYDGDTEVINNIVIDGATYTVTERGILIKDDVSSAELVKENVGKNGVVGITASSLENNYTYNSVTGTVSFSARIDGAEKDDKLTAVAYVVLNDGSLYYSEEVTTSFEDIEDGIDTIPATVGEETAYVYLPAGTEISSAAPAATYYSDFFTEETDVVSDGVMQKGAYVNFSEETSADNVTVPAELGYTVEIGTQEELYYGPDVSLVKKQLSTVADTAVNYIFITDIHYKNYGTASMSKYEHDGPMDRQLERIVKFANENDAIDFIVVGGDTTTGQYGSAEGCMDATAAALEPLKNSTKPVFVLMGNHDDDSYGEIRTGTDESLIPTYIVSDKYWNDRILDVYSPNVVHNSNYLESKYYYYDLTDKKTRVVCLDSTDCEAEFDENGVVTSLKLLDETKTAVASKYRTGYSYFGFSEKQLKWLVEEALTAEDGWNYIFVSHMGIDSGTNGTTPVFGSELRKIIAAYQNKTSYYFTGEEVTIDVAFSDSGRIMSYQHGHVHYEVLHYSEDIDLWQIASDSANLYQTNNTIIDRAYMTNSEAAFDIMSVTENTVHKLNVGAGVTKKLYYSE